MDVGSTELRLSTDEQRYLLAVARQSICRRLGVSCPEPSGEVTQTLRMHCGAFVTLHAQGRLRGCIGHTVASRPLYRTVQEVAASSAFDDPRFPPVTAPEVPSLRIEISALSPLRRIGSVEEIVVGTHGLLMRKGYRSGLLLPQVATEQGWDRETFLEHTCLKAGLPPGAWKERETEIEVFSAFVFSEG